jgi:hypothetical protein
MNSLASEFFVPTEFSNTGPGPGTREHNNYVVPKIKIIHCVIARTGCSCL